MTAHNDRIRQTEHAAGVHDDLPWSVGDVAHDPWAEDMPDGIILVDAEGDAWRLVDEDWEVTGEHGPINPRREWGPYEVIWLPKEDA